MRKDFATTASSRPRFIAGGIAATAATIGIVRTPAKAAQFVYKFATNQPTDHPLTARGIETWERVRRDTGGRLEVQTFPNSQLGSDVAMLQQVRAGAIQFNLQAGSILANVVPLATIQNMPFAFKDTNAVHAAYDGELGAIVRKEIAARTGLHVFGGILDAGFRDMTSSKSPIRTVDDLQGLKFRAPAAPLFVDLFRTLGCNVTSIGIEELYTGLQAHVVDAEENSLSIMFVHKLYEVQKYLSITNHMWDGFFVVANNEAWNALPHDIQTAVERNVPQYVRDETRDVVQLDRTLVARLHDHGMAVNTVDIAPFRAKLKDFYARWREKLGPVAWAALEKTTGPLG